jgi:hypothetical protein
VIVIVAVAEPLVAPVAVTVKFVRADVAVGVPPTCPVNGIIPIPAGSVGLTAYVTVPTKSPVATNALVNVTAVSTVAAVV